MEVFQHDAEFAFLLAALLVLPGIVAQPAFDQNRAALFQILADGFGGFAESIHVHKGHLFLHFAGFAFPLAVAGDAETRNGRALGRVTQFGIAGQVAGKDDFVEAGHNWEGWGLFGGFGLGRRREENAENLLVQRQFRPQLRDDGWRAGENDICVKAGIVFFIGHARKTFPVHFLNRFDFAARRCDFGGNFVEGVFDAFFPSRRIQDEQTFVSFHCFFSSFAESTTPLNWFIAFCIPSFNQHSAWSAARSKTFFINALSFASKRLST